MNAYCRNCGGIGRLSTVYGVAHCVYCGSALVTLTTQDIYIPIWYGKIIAKAKAERAVQEARRGGR